MTKTELYETFLREEGYLPKVDADGDITFKREGKVYILFAGDEDPQYFRLSFPMFWKIENEEERIRAVLGADEINRRFKVVKVHTVQDYVWASIELLLEPLEGFRNVFERSAQLLAVAVAEFRHLMMD